MTAKLDALCAGAEVPCPDCGPDTRCARHYASWVRPWVKALGDAVREVCLHCCVDGSNIMDNGLPAPCHVCHGLGYTPATDGWVWWEALSARSITTEAIAETVWAKNPKEAFFQALHADLVARGARFPTEVGDAGN